MSLRLKLLLLGLATLILPWGGCQYAREMESALREGEQSSLQAVSQTIAASLQGRTDLLYREALAPPDVPEAPAVPVPPGADPVRAFLNPGPYDLKPLALTAAPLLDGYPDDWPHDPSAWAYFGKDDLHRFGILTGVYERMLYVLLEVRDEHPLFDAAGTNTLDPATFGDRVWLGFEDSGGEQHTLGRLIVAAPELASYLTQFMQPGLKLAVTTPSGRVLARADALAQVSGLGSDPPILARLYRRFVDRPGAQPLLESPAPI